MSRIKTKFNGNTVTVLNELVYSLDKFNTYVFLQTEEKVGWRYGVWVNPVGFQYGTEGTLHSAMEGSFYDYNKALLEAGISIDQMAKIDSTVQTRENNTYDFGQMKGASWERSKARAIGIELP